MPVILVAMHSYLVVVSALFPVAPHAVGALGVVLRHVVYSLEAGGSQLMPLWVR